MLSLYLIDLFQSRQVRTLQLHARLRADDGSLQVQSDKLSSYLLPACLSLGLLFHCTLLYTVLYVKTSVVIVQILYINFKTLNY